jgi:hypothetical protein
MLDEAISHTELTIVPVQKPGDQEFISRPCKCRNRHIATIIEYSDEKGAEYSSIGWRSNEEINEETLRLIARQETFDYPIRIAQVAYQRRWKVSE